MRVLSSIGSMIVEVEWKTGSQLELGSWMEGRNRSLWVRTIVEA
jgi:hypothetical protein